MADNTGSVGAPLKARLKRSARVVRAVRLLRWLASLLRNPPALARTVYYLLRLKRCGVPVDFAGTMVVRGARNVSIGSGCSFSNFVILDGHDRITIGDNCMFAN